MRNWEGIRWDTAADANGAAMAVNLSFYREGEITRRYGISKFTAQSGTVFKGYGNPLFGRYVIFVTSTGTVEAILT